MRSSFEKRLTRDSLICNVYQNNLIASILIVAQARSTFMIAYIYVMSIHYNNSIGYFVQAVC